jgi:hypothetical protein
MPDRENEYWASRKEEDLRYCSKHKRFYRYELGCQLCWIEAFAPSNLSKNTVSLEKCPSCNQTSLFWIETIEEWECLNLSCRKKFTRYEILQVECAADSKQPESQISTLTPENLIKCLNCLQISLFWNPKQSQYECLNLKCKKVYTKQQYDEEKAVREAEPKGKAWFGNEYFDPKKKKWRKP